MFRKTTLGDIRDVIDIYNQITNRNRTIEQHQWEWFSSPYLNVSNVIVDSNNSVLGHHGVLGTKFYFNGLVVNVGKTENTIIKKEFGAIYPRNERSMFNEYRGQYDLVVTTSAVGVTKKIRESLGYVELSSYVRFVKVLSLGYALKKKVESSFLMKLLQPLVVVFDFFVRLKLFNSPYRFNISELKENDLDHIDKIAEAKIAKKFFYQSREKDFLRYRLLNNPYKKYSVLTVMFKEKKIGFAVLVEKNKAIYIEDIVGDAEEDLKHILNTIFFYGRKSKAEVVFFSTLKNSVLDNNDLKKAFSVRREESGGVFMINFLNKTDLNETVLKKMYITPLIFEGVI